jgi:hypothetical protein
LHPTPLAGERLRPYSATSPNCPALMSANVRAGRALVLSVRERRFQGRSDDIDVWRRREGDSNPRGACTPNGFQDRRIRPLCHPSSARKLPVGSADSAGRAGLVVGGSTGRTWLRPAGPAIRRRATSPARQGRSTLQVRLRLASAGVDPTSPGQQVSWRRCPAIVTDDYYALIASLAVPDWTPSH